MELIATGIDQGRLDQLRREWVESLDVKPITRTAYSASLKAFFLWTTKTGRGLDLLATDILAYKQYLLETKSNLTVTAYLTAVRLFYSWLEGGRIYHNIAKGIRSANRSGKYQRQYLTADQVAALLREYAPGSRDYALVNLAVRTGLRTIEIVRARIQDLTVKQGRRVLMIQGKGRDHREDYVILTDKALEPLVSYLESCRPGAALGEPLFTNESRNGTGQALTTRSIRAIVGRGLDAIGLTTREYSAHSLRHTAAVHMIKAGKTLDEVQGELRHTSPATTQIYLKTIADDQRLTRAAISVLDTVY